MGVSEFGKDSLLRRFFFKSVTAFWLGLREFGIHFTTRVLYSHERRTRVYQLSPLKAVPVQ